MVNSSSPGTNSDTNRRINRRTVLGGVGAGLVAGSGLVGTASAHSVNGKPAFYGTSQLSVCVRGNSDVLMARENDGGYEVGFVVGANRLDPYPNGKPRYSGNYTVSTDDPEVPDGLIIGLQVEGTRWVNPNASAQAALEAEREQLDSSHDRPEGISAGPDDTLPCKGEPIAAPDVPLLNYALTLEHLEYAFYRDGLAEFSDEELMNADVLADFGEKVRTEVPGYLETVGAHEEAHVDVLTATVEKLGGTAVEEGEYDFGYTTPSEFLGVAKALENTGVAAYAGAAPTVANDDVFAAAIGIHSVEARHAGFLNEPNGTSPFPDAVDAPKTMEEVTTIAGQFIVDD